MRTVSTSFICVLLSTLGAVDTKQESWRVAGGGGGWEGDEKIFLLYYIIFSKRKINLQPEISQPILTKIFLLYYIIFIK